MIRIQRILVPTDFSSCGDSAIRQAIRLARIHEAEIHLLHALGEWRFDSLFQLHDSTDREAMQRILRYRADHRLHDRASDMPVPTEAHVVEGRRRPASAIVSFAERRGMHLIVISTHGHGGFRRQLPGRVPHDVLRRAPCPVLTVHPNDPHADEQAGFRSILVPVDFSWCSRLALSYAIALAAAHGATLQLLHVVSEVTCPEFYLHGSQVTHQGRLHLEARAERRLKDLVDGTGQSDSRQVSVRFGRPASEIVRFAREAGSDLILMASHGLGGLMKVMLGSVTLHVTHAAPCSVLVTNWGRQMVPGAQVVASHYRALATPYETAGTANEESGTKATM